MKMSMRVFWKHPLLLLASLLLFLQLSPSFVFAAEVEFILDASGSMGKPLGALTKIEVAKQSILSTLKEVDPAVKVALRVYGHNYSNQQKELSCKDSVLVIPFSAPDISAFESSLSPIKTNGFTPIAYSLELASKDFSATEEKRIIILVSDGEETCDGDPVEAIRTLKTQGFKVTVHVIGFDVDQATRDQLNAIASTGGGEYFDASSQDELATRLKDITEKEDLLIEKKEPTYEGTLVRGGDDFYEAVPITPGLYRLDHYQRRQEYDYFKLNVKTNKTYKFAVIGSGRYIRIENGVPEVWPREHRGYAGLQVYDENKSPILSVQGTGVQRGERVEKIYNPKKDGFVYLLIGSLYDAMDKEAAFEITVQEAAAPTIPPKRTPIPRIPIQPPVSKSLFSQILLVIYFLLGIVSVGGLLGLFFLFKKFFAKKPSPQEKISEEESSHPDVRSETKTPTYPAD